MNISGKITAIHKKQNSENIGVSVIPDGVQECTTNRKCERW